MTATVELRGPFGTATVEPERVTLRAAGHELYCWATYPGWAWPCSELRDRDGYSITFTPDRVEQETEPPVGDAAEVCAWYSSALAVAGLDPAHPCYSLAVGQHFDPADLAELLAEVTA